MYMYKIYLDIIREDRPLPISRGVSRGGCGGAVPTPPPIRFLSVKLRCAIWKKKERNRKERKRKKRGQERRGEKEKKKGKKKRKRDERNGGMKEREREEVRV